MKSLKEYLKRIGLKEESVDGIEFETPDLTPSEHWGEDAFEIEKPLREKILALLSIDNYIPDNEDPDEPCGMYQLTSYNGGLWNGIQDTDATWHLRYDDFERKLVIYREDPTDYHHAYGIMEIDGNESIKKFLNDLEIDGAYIGLDEDLNDEIDMEEMNSDDLIKAEFKYFVKLDDKETKEIQKSFINSMWIEDPEEVIPVDERFTDMYLVLDEDEDNLYPWNVYGIPEDSGKIMFIESYSTSGVYCLFHDSLVKYIEQYPDVIKRYNEQQDGWTKQAIDLDSLDRKYKDYRENNFTEDIDSDITFELGSEYPEDSYEALCDNGIPTILSDEAKKLFMNEEDKNHNFGGKTPSEVLTKYLDKTWKIIPSGINYGRDFTCLITTNEQADSIFDGGVVFSFGVDRLDLMFLFYLEDDREKSINTHPVEEEMKDGKLVIYRVDPNDEDDYKLKFTNEAIFFSDSLEYYDYSDTGYSKHRARAYYLNLDKAKVFDPMKIWNKDIDVNSWSDIRCTEEFASEKGIEIAYYLDDIDYDDPNQYHEVMLDTDSLARFGRDNGYDVTILRDIPSQGGRGPKFTEYAVHNSKVIKPVKTKSLKEDDENISFEELDSTPKYDSKKITDESSFWPKSTTYRYTKKTGQLYNLMSFLPTLLKYGDSIRVGNRYHIHDFISVEETIKKISEHSPKYIDVRISINGGGFDYLVGIFDSTDTKEGFWFTVNVNNSSFNDILNKLNYKNIIKEDVDRNISFEESEGIKPTEYYYNKNSDMLSLVYDDNISLLIDILSMFIKGTERPKSLLSLIKSVGIIASKVSKRDNYYHGLSIWFTAEDGSNVDYISRKFYNDSLSNKTDKFYDILKEIGVDVDEMTAEDKQIDEDLDNNITFDEFEYHLTYDGDDSPWAILPDDIKKKFYEKYKDENIDLFNNSYGVKIFDNIPVPEENLFACACKLYPDRDNYPYTIYAVSQPDSSEFAGVISLSEKGMKEIGFTDGLLYELGERIREFGDKGSDSLSAQDSHITEPEREEPVDVEIDEDIDSDITFDDSLDLPYLNKYGAITLSTEQKKVLLGGYHDLDERYDNEPWFVDNSFCNNEYFTQDTRPVEQRFIQVFYSNDASVETDGEYPYIINEINLHSGGEYVGRSVDVCEEFVRGLGITDEQLIGLRIAEDNHMYVGLGENINESSDIDFEETNINIINDKDIVLTKEQKEALGNLPGMKEFKYICEPYYKVNTIMSNDYSKLALSLKYNKSIKDYPFMIEMIEPNTDEFLSCCGYMLVSEEAVKLIGFTDAEIEYLKK